MNSAFALSAMVALALACRPVQPERTGDRAPMAADLLELTLETDKSTYRTGEAIDLILRLTNRSSQDTALQFSSGQRYDFQIADSTGTTMWTWSADRSFMQVLGSEPLAAGASREHRERFTGQLPPGKYAATGSVTVMRSPLTASTTITVQ
jgi:hypothetical protein